MTHLIPQHCWLPLSVNQVMRVFADAPFAWGLAGRYAIEQFAGKSFRDHGDIDVLVFRDDQPALQEWLDPGWLLYAADPPGSLRFWKTGEFLPLGIHDIWAHRKGTQSWQMQVMFMEVAGNRWFSRRNHAIGGGRNQLFAIYNGIPCLRVEVQLLFKSKNCRQKDDVDFQACLPKLRPEARRWLSESLETMYPNGHSWRESLGATPDAVDPAPWRGQYFNCTIRR